MKEELRSQFLLARKGLSQKRRMEAHSLVFEKLYEMTKEAKKVLSYNPLSSEVCVLSFNKKLCEEGRLSLPRIEGHLLVPCDVKDMENELKTFSHKFSEPIFSCPQSLDVDLVVVPGIAFDKNGGRVGFGKGHYDRFLEQRDITTIGICYKEQVYEGVLPLDNHDIAMEKLCIV